jgi:hypothetical protein
VWKVESGAWNFGTLLQGQHQSCSDRRGMLLMEKAVGGEAGSMEVWKYGSMEVWKYGSVEVGGSRERGWAGRATSSFMTAMCTRTMPAGGGSEADLRRI